jgi:hypothetical protein
VTITPEETAHAERWVYMGRRLTTNDVIAYAVLDEQGQVRLYKKSLGMHVIGGIYSVTVIDGSTSIRMGTGAPIWTGEMDTDYTHRHAEWDREDAHVGIVRTRKSMERKHGSAVDKECERVLLIAANMTPSQRRAFAVDLMKAVGL